MEKLSCNIKQSFMRICFKGFTGLQPFQNNLMGKGFSGVTRACQDPHPGNMNTAIPQPITSSSTPYYFMLGLGHTNGIQ